MDSQYFFLELTPNIASKDTPFHFTKVFLITYDGNGDLRNKQDNYESDYRQSLGNPDNYGQSWSKGQDKSTEAEKEKKAVIDNINAGLNPYVSDDPWPI